MNLIPQEIIGIIFSFVSTDTKSILNARKSCKYWKHIIDTFVLPTAFSDKQLVFKDSRLYDKIPPFFTTIDLQTNVLKRKRIGFKSIDFWNSIPKNVKHVRMMLCTNEELFRTSCLRLLEFESLCVNIQWAALDELIPSIIERTQLTICYCGQSELENVKQMTSLKNLGISMTDDDIHAGGFSLDFMMNLQNLEEFSFRSDNPNYSTQFLNSLTNLTSLTLDGFIVLDSDIFLKVSKLKKLDLHGHRTFMSEIENLSILTNLEYLSVTDDFSTIGLSKLTRLSFLCIDQVYGIETKWISELVNLKNLCFIGGYGNEFIQSIYKLTKLQTLYLESHNMSCEYLDFVKGLPKSITEMTIDVVEHRSGSP